MWLRALSLISLVVLLFLELLLSYDSIERQIALASTNVLGVALFYGVQKYLRKKEIILPAWLWLLVALGIWFDAAGNFAHLYARFNWWDQLVHFVGPVMVAAITVYIFKGLRERGLMAVSLWWHNLIVISVAMFFTVLYELTEYLGDILFATQRITNLLDTADDLWWGLVAISLIVIMANRNIFKDDRTLTQR